MLFKAKESRTKESKLCIKQRKVTEPIFVIVGGNCLVSELELLETKRKPFVYSINENDKRPSIYR